MSVEGSFAVLAALAILFLVYGTVRYRTLLNPVSIFVGVEIGLLTLFSGFLAYRGLDSSDYSATDVVKTTMVSIVYLAGTALPYLSRDSLTARVFAIGPRLLGLNAGALASRFSIVKLAALLSAAALAFAALAVLGGGGALWITHSRQAYLEFRAGVGPFFAMTQWLLALAFLYCLWSCRPRRLRLAFATLCFAVLASFMGSKNNILLIFVVAIAYRHFAVKRISIVGFALAGVVFLAGIMALLVAHGSFASLPGAYAYFTDYFDTTAMLMSRFDEFGYLHGKGWLSSLWFYVPRGLYAGKPYEYGVVLIHKVLFPGAAAQGHTPGILPWALSYLDFGILGVFVAGLGKGLWQRMAYEHFLRHRQGLFAFLLMLQFSLWPVLTFAPLPIVLALCVGFMLILKLSSGLRAYGVTTI